MSRERGLSRRLVLGMAAMVAACVTSFSPAAGRPVLAAAGALPDLNQVDPVQYSYAAAKTEWHRVLTRDGFTYVWVDIIRPTTATRLPTIIDASPYFNTLGRGWQHQLKDPHDPTIAAADPTYAAGPRVPFPEYYASYFVPRGYAVALIDLRGTRNSTGCNVYGGREEATDAVDVIDWMHDQPWSNGKFGMIGGSYDGTIANAAAAEEPVSGKYKDALAAIVPVRAIDRWYDYQYYNGVMALGQALDPVEFTGVFPAEDTPNSGLAADPLYAADLAQRKTCPVAQLTTVGQYATPYQNADNAFWMSRDFLRNAPTWHAATFFIHGQFDFNVKTMNMGQLWQALPAGVPKKLWFFNGDHDDPDVPNAAGAAHAGFMMPYQFQAKYRDGVHRWFLQFLKGVDSGALQTPAVEVQRSDGHFDGYNGFAGRPVDQVLTFGANGAALRGPAPGGSVSWDDSASGAAAAASQVFLSTPFTGATRLSGQLQFDLGVSALGPDTDIAVRVEDVPPGAAAKAPAATNDGKMAGPFVFTHAYLRTWYRDTVKPRGASTPTGGGPLVPTQEYHVSFPSLYLDYVVPAGHRLRFTFANSTPDSIPSLTGQVVTMYTGEGHSSVRLPLAGSVDGAPPGPGAQPPVIQALPNTSRPWSPAPAVVGVIVLIAVGRSALRARRTRSS